jgi:predicted HTH domain antitoxin
LIDHLLIRKYLYAQTAKCKLKEAGEKYRYGLISLEEAAALAKVSIYEMIDYIEQEKIHPLSYTEEKGE